MGTVVIIGSRSGWTPAMPPVGFYAASKAAVHGVYLKLSVRAHNGPDTSFL